jgi:hypothetical protein
VVGLSPSGRRPAGAGSDGGLNNVHQPKSKSNQQLQANQCYGCHVIYNTKIITMFASAYQRLSAGYSIVFFSHNKLASVRISQPETIH